MARQNINQYVYPNFNIKLALETYDVSLTSDEVDYNQEVVFSPYLIAQTYGNRLPFYFDINNTESVQNLTLIYSAYNPNNVFVSLNYYNPKNDDLSCFNSQTTCDIGLTGTDNGLVSGMTGYTLTFTKGLLDDSLKFNRLYYDRRLKLFQVTGYTSSPNVRFSGFTSQIIYPVVSDYDPFIGRYHELYGGFYQGFYRLFGYDYDIFPERMNKGWSVEMILRPRWDNLYSPGPGETLLNTVYPNNKDIFFYMGTRAENKYHHHADGYPNCLTGYTRVTENLTGITTCSCCDRTISNSRCIYVYPPRSKDGVHDPHINYGCDKCNGNQKVAQSCGCGCVGSPCQNCGWECQTHICDTIIQPTPTPVPSPTPTPSSCETTPSCTPCVTCSSCQTCDDCTFTGFTSVEDTCEKDPLYDSMSNVIAFKLSGDPKNPGICVRVLTLTGDCVTTGSCSTSGITYETGYTITQYCSPGPIYPECMVINPDYLNYQHWFQFNAVWERYSYFDDCDLWYRGGLGDITNRYYLESLANNSISLVKPPYTRLNADPAEQIDIVNLNEKWLLNKKYRKGRLKIYINGKLFWTIEDFEEIIPRALNTDKERQIGVPFNISWGGGTQGLRENLVFSSSTLLNGPYIQDPECLPTNDLSGTSLSSLTTNILLEQNFGGTFEGAISQFRMYITPLSSPEVKHNFKLNYVQFQMFNPDCPNCETAVCSTDEFTYQINS